MRITMQAPEARTPSSPKTSANISVNTALLQSAKKLRLNVSQAAERGLALAVQEKQAELWLQENREALSSSNDYIEKNGLPLAKYRQF